MGISSRNGAELAVDEINRSGGVKGRNIELIVKDDKGLPEEAVKVDRELIEEKVILGIGHMTSGTGLPGLEVFKQAGILMVSPLMSADVLKGKDDIFLRVIGSNREQSELLADTAASLDLKNGVAVLFEYNNRVYSQEVCNFFKERYENDGGKIVYEDSFVSSDNVDFDYYAGKIKESGADGVLIVSGGLDLGILTQKIKQEMPETAIFSPMWGMTKDAIVKGGKAIEGAYFTGVYNETDQSEEFVRFRKAYQDRFHEEPDYASLYAYETVKIIAQALAAINKTDTESIKRQIIKTKEFRGLQDHFIINSDGDAQRNYFLFKVENERYIRIK